MDPPKCVTLGYSSKNIPLPSNEAFMKRMIEMVESVLKRMRWKAFHFLRGDGTKRKDEEEKYGLKSQRCPPQVDELRLFESDMMKLIENLEFRRTNDEFQEKLKNDIKRIKSSNAVFVPADKTKNLYEMDAGLYNKLLDDNITKHYQAAPDDAYHMVNTSAKRIAKELNVADRLETLARKKAFITLKDHKPNFSNNLPCRLINPAKSELGLISKHILDRINGRLLRTLDVRQWRDSSAVIEWFQSIREKQHCVFTCLDIVEFYPSISEKLLRDALNFASKITDVTESDREVIFHSRKSLLFGDKDWVKKDNALFDVTMGSYDGAEVCELVGTYALARLPEKYKKGTGLYRDDGLAVHRNVSGSEADRARKAFIKHFSSLGLRITIETNLKVANYLDLTLNLNTGKFKPYRKPNDTPFYINKKSNHPPTILKGLPAAVSRRITDNSSDQACFDEAAPQYNSALEASGFDERIDYLACRKSDQKRKDKRQRSRDIIWFNPPFSKTVKTRVGARFLQLIDKHFPSGSKLSKIFNRNNVKVSYSCLPNVAAIIKAHNNRVLEKHATSVKPERTCNCRAPSNCPLDGECLASSIVYKATVEENGSAEKKQYIGLSEGAFKQRYANHLSSFRHDRYKDATELSKHIWDLKAKGSEFAIHWSILRRAPAYAGASQRCALCLTEKMCIATADRRSTLNKRSELVSKCRHRNKFSLLNYVSTG